MLIIYSLIFAVIGVVYIKILAQEPVLNWWFKFGLKFEKKWFWWPIWGCHLCFTGQLALWTYVINWISQTKAGNVPFFNYLFLIVPKYVDREMSLFWLVFSITSSILSAFVIGKIYDHINQKIK